jgi:hypothetical protein
VFGWLRGGWVESGGGWGGCGVVAGGGGGVERRGRENMGGEGLNPLTSCT